MCNRCGAEEPEAEHECKPTCTTCGEEHLAGSKDCKKRYKQSQQNKKTTMKSPGLAKAPIKESPPRPRWYDTEDTDDDAWPPLRQQEHLQPASPRRQPLRSRQRRSQDKDSDSSNHLPFKLQSTPTGSTQRSATPTRKNDPFNNKLSAQFNCVVASAVATTRANHPSAYPGGGHLLKPLEAGSGGPHGASVRRETTRNTLRGPTPRRISHPVPATAVTFSGYPGSVSSGDDFFLTSTNLAVLGTGVRNQNSDLWSRLTPNNTVPSAFRSLAASRLARSAKEWIHTYSRGSAGTYVPTTSHHNTRH
ncbi:hypothetical protein MTO96_020414 [Rhipicephalus appendiculatus]